MKRCLLYLSVAVAMFAQTPAPAPDTTAVVGTLGGKDFTVADLQKALATKEPKFAENFRANPESALSTLMVYQYLTEEAEKRKLAERGDVKEQIQATVTELLRRAVVDDERNNYPVSNEEAETFYNAHKAQFQQTKIKAIYIAFKSATPVGGTSPEALRAAAQAAVAAQAVRSEAEAYKLASDIVKKLREGLDFSKAVEQYSEDAPSKAAGGDYGFIKADSAYPEDFRRAVLALKPGEFSEPLHQAAGYYIIRGEEATTQPMADVLTNIVDAIRKDHFNEWMKEEVTDKHKFVAKDLKLLQSVGLPGAPPPLLAAPK